MREEFIAFWKRSCWSVLCEVGSGSVGPGFWLTQSVGLRLQCQFLGCNPVGHRFQLSASASGCETGSAESETGPSGWWAGHAELQPECSRKHLKRLVFPYAIKGPFSFLEQVGQLLYFMLKLSLSLIPLLKHHFLRISHSTQPKANPFGRKQEEVLIYVSTKPNFIPLEFIELLITLGFVGKP